MAPCLSARVARRKTWQAAQGRMLPQGQQWQKMPCQWRIDDNFLYFGEHPLQGFHKQTLFCDLAGFRIDVTRTLELLCIPVPAAL